jgi:pyruvate,orthophosphate dikinase
MKKWIYHFGAKHSNSVLTNASDILGGKGAGLAEMSKLSMPIPPGFTVITEICHYYYQHERKLPAGFHHEIQKGIHNLEIETGKIFGGDKNPLLLSVRSGSKISMPGMMDTVLNLGMNDRVFESLASESGNVKFALDNYRRFLAMYGSIVLNIPSYLFENAFSSNKMQANIYRDAEITAGILEKLVEDFKKIIIKYSGKECPDDPMEQLDAAIKAVLDSWMSNRAVTYRRLNNIPESSGTAINVQSMVFGNMGETSATGVVFTRCPSSGEKKIFGEFLINAQGEDVVSGTRTPTPISSEGSSNNQSMQQLMPETFNELSSICNKLELYYKDIQDIEFTIENGKLYILQTRSAKRTAIASIKVAVSMVQEKILSKEEAMLRIDPESLGQLLHTTIDYSKNPKPIATGLPASPGAACGMVAFSPFDAEEMSHYHKVILVRNDTSPEDIQGMHVAVGILTARGGMTSHAAVVARGMGRPCVCGVNNIIIDEAAKTLKIGDILIKHGDMITIDGGAGKIFLGSVPLVQPKIAEEFETILKWADEISNLSVRANAETVLDANTAIKFGAKGIGLCRTEHMFFDKKIIPLIREMIIAKDAAERKQSIDKLLPLQINDFKALFRTMNGKPINIRLLDPPLHEFLPKSEVDISDIANNLNMSITSIRQRLDELHEVNPMLGHRGCRLGISCPEIYQMQVEAIFNSIKELKTEENIDTILELMIPLISNVNELKKIKFDIQQVVKDIENKANYKFHYAIGTMIEIPRAALTADEIAPEVDFFSFGTNDLTQTTYGISRDDLSSFLPTYLEQKIFDCDPFISIDEKGVGELIKIAIMRGKSANSQLKLGACGEHAGNPKSIEFLNKLGINYISCSPYRIPIAKISAARAKIQASTKN